MAVYVLWVRQKKKNPYFVQQYYIHMGTSTINIILLCNLLIDVKLVGK